VPAEERVPECPTAVIVAKPGRVRWALEEAWDLAVLLEGSVEETPYAGVFVIRAPLSWRDAAGALARAPKSAFIARIVVPGACGSVDAPPRVEVPPRARLIVALRGASKTVDLAALLGGRIPFNVRRSHTVVDVEGVDRVVSVTVGRARSCGYGCLLVAPL